MENKIKQNWIEIEMEENKFCPHCGEMWEYCPHQNYGEPIIEGLK